MHEKPHMYIYVCVYIYFMPYFLIWKICKWKMGKTGNKMNGKRRKCSLILNENVRTWNIITNQLSACPEFMDLCIRLDDTFMATKEQSNGFLIINLQHFKFSMNKFINH